LGQPDIKYELIIGPSRGLMDPYHLFLIFLALYIVILIIIGFVSSRRQRSVTDFWLAGRELGAVTIGFSVAASWITASALLLSTGLFILMGMSSIWIWVFPNIAALLIVAIISGKIKRIPAFTQPELMEIRYDPIIRAPVALAIAVMMILFSVVDFIGFKLVLGTFFGVLPQYAILLMAASVAFYVGIGGFKAVVKTDIVQYLLLAGLALSVADIAMRLPGESGTTFQSAAAGMGQGWWNPFALFGLLGALMFQMALLPGWVVEQDPWQKIWASRDESSARRGLLLGAGLMALVYAACLITAIGLTTKYPMPTGEVEAEMLYLKLIGESVSPAVLALLTVGFAAASMSCTDTFATSGASCISRDLVQRHILPQASMKEMLLINRALVIVMIAISAAIALRVESIMDAVIIATVIGTTSYFFPIIGGLYWKRATKWGALAALIVGGGTQMLLISSEQFLLGMPLSVAYPQHSELLTEHGVLIGLTLSAISFIGISLATRPTEEIRLAPFFPDVAERVFAGLSPDVDRNSPRHIQAIKSVDEKVVGERVHIHLYIEAQRAKADGRNISGELQWERFVQMLKSMHPSWYAPTGSHVVYRLSQADMLSSIKMVRGDALKIWLSAEPRLGDAEGKKDELCLAYEEVSDVLLEMGLTSKAGSP
jgi:solute:Na+ symporter, SSS family